MLKQIMIVVVTAVLSSGMTILINASDSCDCSSRKVGLTGRQGELPILGDGANF